VLRELNWNGVFFGSGAGLLVGIGLFAAIGGGNAPSLAQVLVQFAAFFVAGMVAGRLSLVGAIPAGGFAALALYFGLAVISVVSGAALQPVALLFFGVMALVLGSAGAGTILAIRRT
jgi:hypothetical protein